MLIPGFCTSCNWFDSVNKKCHVDPPIGVYNGNIIQYIFPTVQPTDWCSRFYETSNVYPA